MEIRTIGTVRTSEPREDNRRADLELIAKSIAKLVAVKDKNYNGAYDIAVDRFGDSYFVSKLFEKYSRLEHMVLNNVKDSESIEDTLKDIIGYSLLTLRRLGDK